MADANSSMSVHAFMRLLRARRRRFEHGERKFAVVCAQRVWLACDAAETQPLPRFVVARS